jgi:integrase
MTNTAWHTALRKVGLKDLRFHDLRHTRASWHRQSGTTVDELTDLGGWKSRGMVDRYAKFATETLEVAAPRIETGKTGNVVVFQVFPTSGERLLSGISLRH